MALARVIGGPASGITNEEAVEAARFRDDLKIQKCGHFYGLGRPVEQLLTACGNCSWLLVAQVL